ncbi:MAG: Asp-tRNA(Asn)/Glu-tRNA(Gln) amidotransferase subunit GatC [Myxococcales bacterium]
MKLSLEQVRHVARLARLTLSPAEEERYARQLGEVLGYVEALSEVDTSAVVPTAHAAEIPNPMRDDVVLPSLDPEVALANAPARSGTAVAVPKIIE